MLRCTLRISYMVKVVEGEGGVIAPAEPPRVADVLLIVPSALGKIESGVGFGTVKGKRLRIAVETDDAVDTVAV